MLVFGPLRSMLRSVFGPVFVETLVRIKLSVEMRFKIRRVTTSAAVKPSVSLVAVIPPHILGIVSEHIDSLKLLVQFSTVCRLTPSANTWNNALQSTFPMCTNLPVGHPMPDYYRFIAMWYFDPRPIGQIRQTEMCDSVMSLAIPSLAELYTPIGGQRDGFRFYAQLTLSTWNREFYTKKGRAHVKILLMELKERFLQHHSRTFIDVVINILDTSFNAAWHRLLPF
jgi:hypothetical protein